MSPVIAKLPQHPPFAVRMPEPGGGGGAPSDAFADLLGYPGGGEDLPQENWSEAGLPVRAHTRRFDQTSLLALAAAIGAPGGIASAPASEIAVRKTEEAGGGDLLSPAASSMPSGSDPEAPHAAQDLRAEPTHSGDFPLRSDQGTFVFRSGGERLPDPAKVRAPLAPALAGAAPGETVAGRSGQVRTGQLKPQSSPRGPDLAGRILREMTTNAPPSSHAVQVALCALENGLRVLVRLPVGDQTDPAELRKALEALLAEHGYPQADIHLAGALGSRQIGEQ